MENNIKEDLALFNELVAVFLEDEIQNPVSEYINPKELDQVIDIKLGKDGIEEKEFKRILRKLVLQNSKLQPFILTSIISTLFMFSYQAEELSSHLAIAIAFSLNMSKNE